MWSTLARARRCGRSEYGTAWVKFQSAQYAWRSCRLFKTEIPRSVEGMLLFRSCPPLTKARSPHPAFGQASRGLKRRAPREAPPFSCGCANRPLPARRSRSHDGEVARSRSHDGEVATGKRVSHFIDKSFEVLHLLAPLIGLLLHLFIFEAPCIRIGSRKEHCVIALPVQSLNHTLC